MHLKSILYVSAGLKNFTPKELEDLAEIAYSNNLMLNLSGYLFHAKNTFIQYLEGPEENLNELFSRICSDDRHTVIRWISDEKLEARRFPDWSMRYLAENELEQAHLEALLVEQIKLMRNFHLDGAEFADKAFSIVDQLATDLAAIPLANERSQVG